MRPHVLSLILILATSVAGQARPIADARPDRVASSYIVRFAKRSFDLSALRTAIYGNRPAAEVETIVAGYRRAVTLDQAAFVANLRRLGGRVAEQWWIINGCAVFDVRDDALGELRTLPNVASVEPNAIHYPTLTTYTNASNHNTDAANSRRDKNSVLVRGKGIGIAILDTGVDHGQLGRPHRGFYPGGNANNRTGPGISGSNVLAVFGTSGAGTQDVHGHGTHVSGDAAANSAPDNGPAPDAGVVGVKISDNRGSAQSNWLIAGWQLVAAQRVKYNICVANNSFTGSPSMFSGIQAALDTTAATANVAITCSAGNTAANTNNSQSVYNGLAVGSFNKNSPFSRSSFSAIGPLSGSSRKYPHIMGGGSGTVSMYPGDRIGSASGTSMSSPMVAGILALIWQAGIAADPKFDANCARAIALNNTLGSSNRNGFGEGVAKAEAAVDAIARGDFLRDQVTQSARQWNDFFAVKPGTATVALTWMRASGSATPPDLDLKIYDQSNQLVAHDADRGNSYEKVTIKPTGSATWRVEVTWLNPTAATIDFCIAGVGKGTPVQKPTLTAAAPNRVSNFKPGQIALTGTNFRKLTKVTLGGQPVQSYSVTSDTAMNVTIGYPATIGSFSIVVENTAGKSNPLTLTVNGSHPSVIEGRTIAVRNVQTDMELFTDKSWRGLILVSTAKSPSKVAGLIDLGIGGNFSVGPWQVAVLNADNRGHGKVQLTFPASIPQFSQFHFQAVTFDPGKLTLPLETSNVMTIQVF